MFCISNRRQKDEQKRKSEICEKAGKSNNAKTNGRKGEKAKKKRGVNNESDGSPIFVVLPRIQGFDPLGPDPYRDPPMEHLRKGEDLYATLGVAKDAAPDETGA